MEKKLTLFIYPNIVNNKNVNPYMSLQYKALSKYFKIVNIADSDKPTLLSLIKHTNCNYYILNWPENVIFKKFGYIQFIILIIILNLILLKGAKIIWILHNITPHEGTNFCTKILYSFLLKKTSLIVSHSMLGLKYLNKNSVTKHIFIPHPFNDELKNMCEYPNEAKEKIYDILIWGSILPYKGILEFICFLNEKNINSLRIKIVGKCNNNDYKEKLYTAIKLSSNISFEDRYLDFNELNTLISQSRYTLFPYIGDSVSSSGALMDSLLFGASVIGPYMGAFKDMKDLNLCFCFKKYDDIIRIIDKNIYIDKNTINNFIDENTWTEFAKKVVKELKIQNQ